MNYWIFTVKGSVWGNETHTGEEIFNQRMKDQFWGLGERTPNRQSLNEGDEVVFYIAAPRKVFRGSANLASSSFVLNNTQRQQYGHGTEFYENDYGVLLKDIEIWPQPKAIEDLLPSLRFIENKEFWGGYLQGGVRQITEDDFRTIVGEKSLVEQIVTSKDIESQTEFALETHLEEFIHQNWGKINWGSKLGLYQNDEQNGR
ncbi:MAG TPA: EVE domain-containing protein [Dehalococcoidia bacterium]|nr:EVE domain-containing protein [Dehalococcoidia bacterium]